MAVVVMSKATTLVASTPVGSGPTELGSAMGVTLVVPGDVASDVRVTAVVTFEATGVLGGGKARNSGPPFPEGRPIP